MVFAWFLGLLYICKQRPVRAQDRLTIFQLIRLGLGAFSSITSRGLLYIQSHRFIAILLLILISATQA